MTRYLYDSVNPAAIPSSAVLVAGYADGRYANMAAMAARFRHATRVSIAVAWTTRAQVLDVESGNATPAQAVTWCTQTMADTSNHELTVYCGLEAWPAVRAAFQTAGVTEPNYWVARYDNDPTIPAGAIAKQYIGDHNGYDQSAVADYWPGVDPAPKPTGTPQWQKLLDHVMAVPEGVYEHWQSGGGWDNRTQWGIEFGEDGVPYCVIGAWDEYHECGLDSVVPKTDNVNSFADWARAHGEWTEYPSVGAWMDVGDGSHCEVVIGFTATKVISKGWNSIETGAADSGQGNGVWVHTNDRTDPRVTGYLAPRFPDGACPPTADPQDPRGGTAQASYTPPEDDMTPAQAQQLQDLHDMLTSIGSLVEKDTKGNAVLHGAGYYLAHAQADTTALAKTVAALAKGGGLTVEQVTAAAEAGAKAALAELAAALGKAGA